MIVCVNMMVLRQRLLVQGNILVAATEFMADSLGKAELVKATMMEKNGDRLKV